MSGRKLQHEMFNCSKLGATTKITREILMHFNGSTGEIDRENTVGWDCDRKSGCGIGGSTGAGVGYDWSKCIHPALRRFREWQR